MGRRRKIMADSAALATTDATTAVQYTERDLDTAVAAVQRAGREWGASGWRLGAEIKAIFDKQLWKQRNDATGKAAYKSFNQFVPRELRMTLPYAYTLIRVATDYSEDQARALGTTKLALIAKAPPTERPALQAKAEAGATVREIKHEVESSKRKTGYQRESQGKAVPHNAGKQQPARAPSITVALTSEAQQVQVYVLDNGERRPARANDRPPFYFTITCENGVDVHVGLGVEPKTGTLLADVRAQRDSEGS